MSDGFQEKVSGRFEENKIMGRVSDQIDHEREVHVFCKL